MAIAATAWIAVVPACRALAEDKPCRALAEALKTPDKIHSLDLSGSGLKEFPMDILKLKGLTTLNLSTNQITYLPREICGLQKLQKLDLRGNKVTGLPIGMKQMSGLGNVALDPSTVRLAYGQRTVAEGMHGIVINSAPFNNRALIVNGLEMADRQWRHVDHRWGGDAMVVDGWAITQTWPHIRGRVVTIRNCKVKLETKKNLVSVTATEADHPLDTLALGIHSRGGPAPGPEDVRSVILKEGKHDIEVWCRLKQIPLFYEVVHETTLEVTGSVEKNVETLVKQLGAPEYKRRQKATKELEEFGSAVLPHLEKASLDPDPEISSRAKDLVKQITGPNTSR